MLYYMLPKEVSLLITKLFLIFYMPEWICFIGDIFQVFVAAFVVVITFRKEEKA